MISPKGVGVRWSQRERGKERVTIRLDREVLTCFRAQVEEAGGGNYQTLINRALQERMRHQEEPLEHVLRRVVREELHAVR